MNVGKSLFIYIFNFYSQKDGLMKMNLLILNKNTRSDRKWSWTKRNKSRADDIIFVAEELRQWWPMTARQIYYRLISSQRINRDHWLWKNKRVDIYQALVRTLK